ncbi:MAG TPA: L-glyceraldehyde 3-phosphate reductase [Anaeromyxobacter sp.]|nr:L-glyceraldehyde 3-phosphate reductase [Anaeromyxobacter sp.]
MHVPAPTRYDQDAFYRRCGRSGVRLPLVSLGLWHNFGAVDPYANARAIVLRAFDLGITHFDLANNYGPPPGTAEQTFGRIVREDLAAHRDELFVSTKAGYDMWAGPYGNFGSRKYLLASLDQSLARLGLEYVDLFYHHRPDPETPLEETMGALAHAVHAGKALYVGISNYAAPEAARAIALLRGLGTPCLIHQPRYNMLDRWPEPELFPLLEREGVGCIPFSPLAKGLLTDRYFSGIPADSRAGHDPRFLTPADVTEAVLAKTRRLDAVAKRRGQTLAQLALAWTLRRAPVTSALIGASRPSQVEDNVGALARLEFSAEELAEIDRILAG